MKGKIVLSMALFAASFVLEGIATKVMPFGEIFAAINPLKKL